MEREREIGREKLWLFFVYRPTSVGRVSKVHSSSLVYVIYREEGREKRGRVHLYTVYMLSLFPLSPPSSFTWSRMCVCFTGNTQTRVCTWKQHMYVRVRRQHTSRFSLRPNTRVPRVSLTAHLCSCRVCPVMVPTFVPCAWRVLGVCQACVSVI